jgi:hypothetical protein
MLPAPRGHSFANKARCKGLSGRRSRPDLVDGRREDRNPGEHLRAGRSKPMRPQAQVSRTHKPSGDP